MDELVIAKKNDLVDIANAIRSKTETSDTLALDEMPQMIMDIESGIDTSDATAVASDILSGKTAYVGEEKITGTLPTVTQATPSISVDSAGKITASATQTAGYVAAGTKSATKQLTAQAAQTITPGTSNKTIASGRYLTGTQTIKGDANLVAGNIKSGVTIFNVAGSLKGGPNLSVMGGTTQPAGTENMVWINTGTAINGYVFSADEPTNPAEGMVWIITSTVATVPIDTSDENTVLIYPISCQQYISGAWVVKTAKTYQGGQWKDWGKTLYNYGVTNLEFTFATEQASNGSLQADYIHLESTNKYFGTVTMSCTPAINLTPYTVAKIEIENTGGYATMTIGFGATVGALNEANWSYKGEMAKQTITIDISSLSDNHYLSASRVTNSDSRAVGITKIWSIRLE